MPSKREQLLEIMEDAAKGETKATLRARITELEAENERLRKALEPFALVAEHGIGKDEADSDALRPMPINRAPQITVGHLRAARRALAGRATNG